ncbi:MAG: hypothetical protein R3F13_08325 [Prosthecobacter sp.]
MFRPFARILIAAALMTSIGLHWAVLQSAAWAGMIVSYSLREGSLITGLSQTFDAEHPCTLCGAVAFGMKKEKKDPPQQQSPQKKLVMAVVAAERPVFASPPFSIFSTEMIQKSSELGRRPPSPPPRRGIA